MTEYRAENKLGVGEILICSKDTKGKFESLKYFIGKVILTIGGGGDKIYIVEEKDKVSSEVKSIQSRQTLKDQILYETKINAQKNSNNFSDNEGFRSDEENKMNSNFLMSDEIADKIDSQKEALSRTINKRDSIEENKEETLKKQISHRSDDKNKTSTDMNNKYETLMNDNIEGSFPNPNFDNGSQHLSNDGFTKSGIGFRDKESQIAQIVKGKYHLLKLTVDGKVYASGKSYYGVVGLGGSSSAGKPQLIPNLANIKIKQISTGVYHSLALAENGDLYTWGLGEEGICIIKEGQLGLNSEYKIASSPKYLKFFYKKPVQFIACGHNYSLAITQDARLWGWGENKLGQLGLGKIQVVDVPTHIEILDLPGGQIGCNKADSIMNGNNTRIYSGNRLRACYASAGFAHSAIVTEEGYLVVFGLNIYGQLGLGNTTSTFEPKLIEKDDNGNNINKVLKVSCNTSGTFIITEGGKFYSCGSGDIGHGEYGVVKLPRMLNDARFFSEVFSNDNTVIVFSPLKIISVSPNCGPATGNTILSIIGTALKEFPKLSVRFIYGGIARDVKANFDKNSRAIFVRTPNFLEYTDKLELPCLCKILVTFDGHYFTEWNEYFLIYCKISFKIATNIKMNGIQPKCGPTIGGSSLQLSINLDNIDPKYLFSLTVGFQAKVPIILKKSIADANAKKKKKHTKFLNTNTHETDESRVSGMEDARSQMVVNTTTINQTIVNPMDVGANDPQLEKANWYCAFGMYENETINCKIPKIDNFQQMQVEYNVDIALNGQQFSGYPMIYRFYEIKIDIIEPNISSIEGGTAMKIKGTGFFDSVTKKARISSTFGDRYTDLQWERSEKNLLLVSPPLSWITSNQDVLKNTKPQEIFENFTFDVKITLNNIDWIDAGTYKYFDPKVNRVSYVTFSEGLYQVEGRRMVVYLPEALSPDERVFLGIAQKPDDKKKYDEILKKFADEDALFHTPRRAYNGLYLYGDFFPQTNYLKIKFRSNICEQDTNAFFKNKYKIGCLIPEITKLGPGIHELEIDISVNGIHYFPTNFKIFYNSSEIGMKPEDIMKLDEQELKSKDKGKPKGKK